MTKRIEDYALLGDNNSVALVAKDGSIDWLTFPRFDSSACFAALLGDESNGHWLLAPTSSIRKVTRSYRPGTLILETVFETDDGTVAVIDCMPPRDGRLDLVRVVECRSGRVSMRMHLTVRFDYGSIVPWVRHIAGGITLVAGPDALRLATPVNLHGEDLSTMAEFTVAEHDRVPFLLTYFPSDEPPPQPIDAITAVASAEEWWTDWSSTLKYQGQYADDVRASLVVLKGLTYEPSGGIVAAATTSLPEVIGGQRNWDYRFCWLRDATFSLMALLNAGCTEEAAAWRDWLLRSVAGKADQMQIMYGPAGERRLTEIELDWLGGYDGSKPVRVGNAAHGQFQLDVYGEVMDVLHQARCHGIPENDAAWALQLELMNFLEGNWDKPDDGIWEFRGDRQHFTHSKVMAWVALDRAIRNAEEFGLDGPVKDWQALREKIHAEVLEKGVDDRGVFMQAYGSDELDASLLMVPVVGFLPPDDKRVKATVEAIERDLTQDGFVHRYRTSSETGADGLEGQEGTFLMCTFWLADNLALLGRQDEARKLYERLLGLRNDVGLLAEEYDPSSKRLLGNFPQAFSHVALINTAANLSAEDGDFDHGGPTHQRRGTATRKR